MAISDFKLMTKLKIFIFIKKKKFYEMHTIFKI